MSRFHVLRMRMIFRLTALLVAVGMGMVHVPMPTGRVIEKDRSQPFPCQNRPCGCRSASQCWQKCCCFTNAQKVVWAKTNRVILPDCVIAAAERETGAKCRSKRACCQSNTGVPDHSRESPRTIRDFESNVNANHGGHGQTISDLLANSKRALTPRQQQYVIGCLAQQCQGQGSMWYSVPWSLVPKMVLPDFTQVVSGTVASTPLERCPVVSDRPPLPPPRDDA